MQAVTTAGDRAPQEPGQHQAGSSGASAARRVGKLTPTSRALVDICHIIAGGSLRDPLQTVARGRLWRITAPRCPGRRALRLRPALRAER